MRLAPAVAAGFAPDAFQGVSAGLLRDNPTFAADELLKAAVGAIAVPGIEVAACDALWLFAFGALQFADPDVAELNGFGILGDPSDFILGALDGQVVAVSATRRADE